MIFRLKILLVVAPAVLLAGCVTTVPTRMYSETELNTAGQGCGLALGELAQEAEEPRLLFVIALQTVASQQTCIRRWARRRSLTLVVIEGFERAPAAPEQVQ